MGTQLFLDANFNDKTIGDPIGEGGAALGEPTDVGSGVQAIVREGPMGSPSLEISDQSGERAGAVRFQMLDGVELETGTASVGADLWFHSLGEGNNFAVFLRERDGSAEDFTHLSFTSEGDVYLSDMQGPTGKIGTYQIDRRTRLVLFHDLDAGTYDIWLDGARLVDDRAHGVTGRGIGGVLFGCEFDGDTVGLFHIDAVTVTDTFLPVTVEEGSWGRLKSLFR
jgi:hypothetical protein